MELRNLQRKDHELSFGGWRKEVIVKITLTADEDDCDKLWLVIRPVFSFILSFRFVIRNSMPFSFNKNKLNLCLEFGNHLTVYLFPKVNIVSEISIGYITAVFVHLKLLNILLVLLVDDVKLSAEM